MIHNITLFFIVTYIDFFESYNLWTSSVPRHKLNKLSPEKMNLYHYNLLKIA
jgi:hypothetical protein